MWDAFAGRLEVWALVLAAMGTVLAAAIMGLPLTVLPILDGLLFVDRLSPLKRSLFRKKYQKILEQRQEQL